MLAFNWSEENVQKIMCGSVTNTTTTEQFIVYRNTEEAEYVKDQICNLTRKDLELLIEDFRAEYNISNVMKEVRSDSLVQTCCRHFSFLAVSSAKATFLLFVAL
jgi:hypothetical protein